MQDNKIYKFRGIGKKSMYPNGKPGDPQPEELISQMNSKSIHYVLGEISKGIPKELLAIYLG